MPVKKGGSQRTRSTATFTQNDTVYEVGDCVLIKAGGESTKPYIGRIKRIGNRVRGAVQIYVEWFYRPEESACGRLPFHGDKEVFESDHVDRLPSHVIEDKCSVYTYDEYTQLELITDNEFFYRWKYDPATGEFTPDQVNVYCVCEHPHNPDKPMIGCDQCKDWFHPECIGLSEAEQRRLEDENSTFLCPDCLSKKSAQQNGPRPKKPKYEA